MLLAAVMATSSLPLAVSADNAAAYQVTNGTLNENVEDAAATNDADNSNYLSIGNRAVKGKDTRSRGIRFNVKTVTEADVTAGTVYYVRFKVRTAVDYTTPTIMGAQWNGSKWIANKSWPSTHQMRLPCSIPNLLNDTGKDGSHTYNKFWSVVGGATTGTTWIEIGNTEWTTIELKCKPQNAGTLCLDIQGLYSSRYQHPFDIDQFEVYCREGNTDAGAIIENTHVIESFEGATVVSYQAINYSPATDAKIVVDEYEAYDEIVPDGDAATATEVVKTYNTVLARGVYEVSAEMRYGWFDPEIDSDYAGLQNKTVTELEALYPSGGIKDANGKLKNNSATNVEVQIQFNNGAWKSLSTVNNVNTDWSEVVTSFAVLDDNQTLTGVKYILTKPDDVVAENTVRVRNLGAVACVGLFDETLDFADAENLLDGVNASYSGLIEHAEGTDGGYASMVTALTDSTNNDCIRLGVDTGVESVAGRVYYTSFKARIINNWSSATHKARVWSAIPLDRTHTGASTPLSNDYLYTNSNSELYTDFERIKEGTYYQTFTLGKEWKTYIGSFVPANNGQSISFGLARTTGDTIVPFEMDDVKVWYLDENNDEVVVYENNFNTAADGADIVSHFAGHDKQLFDTYTEITPVENLKAKAEYAVDPADVAADGVYVFTADIATSANGATGTAQIVYTLADGSKSETFAISNDYTEISSVISVANGEPQVTGVALDTDVAGAIKLTNVSLKFVPFEKIETDETDNFLAGTEFKVSGATVADVDAYGYLAVGERTIPPATDNRWSFLVVDFGTTAVKGRTYYVSYDVRQTGGTGELGIRTQMNGVTTSDAGVNSTHLLPSANTKVTWSNAGGQPLYKPTYEWQHIEGSFTPTASGAAMKLHFNKAMGEPDNQPMDIDNFKVWYIANGEEVVVYENDFGFEGAVGSEFTAKATTTHLFDYAHTAITPDSADRAVNVIYALDIPAENAVDADYLFRATVKTAEDVAEDVELTIIYTYDDGTTQSKKFYVDGEWSDIAWYRNVEDKDLVSVTLNFTAPCALLIRDAKLVIEDHKDDGMPNIGILMMLLHKNREGGRVDKIGGYLQIAARTAETSNRYLTFETGATTKAGVKYYVSFDARTTDGTKTTVRPIANFNIKESLAVANGGIKVDGMLNDNGMNGKYIVPNANTTADVIWYTNGAAAGDLNFPCTNFEGKWIHFEGNFTPVDEGQPLTILFERGPSTSFIQPLDVNNMKIWYMDGETEVVVYERNFDAATDIDGITGTAAVSIYLPEHLLPKVEE